MRFNLVCASFLAVFALSKANTTFIVSDSDTQLGVDNLEPTFRKIEELPGSKLNFKKDKFQNTKQIIISFNEADVNNGSLGPTIALLSNTLSELPDQMTSFKKKLNKISLHQSEQQNQISSLINTLSEQQNQIYSLMNTLSQQQNQISSLTNNSNEISLHQSEQQNQISSLINTLSELQNQTSSFKTHHQQGTLVWKISEFSAKVADARQGKNTTLHSTPFYTSEFGYKFQAYILVYPDDGTYISVYVRILPGDYDAVLKWPFGPKVMFTLLNQGEKPNHACIASLRVCDKCSKRPDKENIYSNAIIGCTEFISHEDLKKDQFLREDTLFLRVDVDLS